MPDAGQRERGDGSFFLEKRKNQRKTDWVFLPMRLLIFVLGVTDSLYERRRTFADLTCLLAMSQRRGLTRFFLLSHGLLSGALRDTANRVRWFRQVAPAAGSPPRKRGGSFLFRGAFRA